MKLQLLKFINNHKDNWKELLQQPPYSLIIKEDDTYMLLKYNQLESDFSKKIVRECRGIILDKNSLKIVAFPFTKFFNYGQVEAAKINWKGARVLDKIDGSLIFLWYDRDKWHWSTSGNIDASKTEFSMPELTKIRCPVRTWQELIEYADNYRDIKWDKLDRNCTYMFELVSPYTKVVIPYPYTRLHHLATRNNITYQEEEQSIGVCKPYSYPLDSLEDCIAAAEHLSKDYEGFVVVDKNYHRVKIKNPTYLMMHRMANNGQITLKSVLALIKANDYEEFLSYFPEYKNIFSAVQEILDDYKQTMEADAQKYKLLQDKYSRKDLVALITKESSWKDYIFKQLWSKYPQIPEEYLWGMVGDKLLERIKRDPKLVDIIKN